MKTMASFNETFDTVKDKVSQGAQVAVQMTKDLTAIAKANVAIKTEEGKIRKAEAELGKLYYADYVAGETPEGEAYTPWCEKITESKEAIEAQKAIIEELKADIEILRGGKDSEDDVVIDVDDAEGESFTVIVEEEEEE